MGHNERGHIITGRHGRRLLALLLSLTMLVGLAPGLALAGDTVAVPPVVEQLPAVDGVQAASVTFSGAVLMMDGAGIADANVSVYAADGSLVGTGKTAANGLWQLTATVQPGDYYAMAEKQGITFAASKSGTFTLAQGSTALTISAFQGEAVQQQPNLRFTGTVVDEAGQGLANVAVSVSAGGSVVGQATTSATGDWAVDAVPYAANFSFAYAAEGYLAFMSNLTAVTPVDGQTEYSLGKAVAIAKAAEQPATEPEQPATPATTTENASQQTTQQTTTEQTSQGSTPAATGEQTQAGTQDAPATDTPADNTQQTPDASQPAGDTQTSPDATQSTDGTGTQDETTGEPADDEGMFTFTEGEATTMVAQNFLAEDSLTLDTLATNDLNAITVQLLKFVTKPITVEMGTYESLMNHVEITPDNASMEKGLTYKIEPSNIADIIFDGSGIPYIVGKQVGTAKLSIRLDAYGQEPSVELKVVPAQGQNVTVLQFMQNPIELSHTDSASLALQQYLDIEPATANVNWEIQSGFTILDSIDAWGNVTLKTGATGRASVKVTAANGKTAIGNIVVKESAGVRSFTHSMDGQTYTFTMGAVNSFTMEPVTVIDPINAIASVQWSVVSGGAQLRVTDRAAGKFEALKPGTARVRVAVTNYVGEGTPYVEFNVEIKDGTGSDASRLSSIGFGVQNNTLSLLLNKTDPQDEVSLYNMLVTNPVDYFTRDKSEINANLEWTVASGGTYISLRRTTNDKGLVEAYVKPVRAGTATVQVRDTVSGKLATLTILVSDPGNVSSIWFEDGNGKTIDKLDISRTGGTVNLLNYVRVNPDIKSTSTFTWRVLTSTNVLTVDRNGYVTPRMVGTATVEVVATNGNKSARLELNVTDDSVVQRIKFMQPSVTWELQSGDLDMNKLVEEIYPSTANQSSKTWSVTSSGQAMTINNKTGILTPKQVGTGVVRLSIGTVYDTIAVKIVDSGAPTKLTLFGGENPIRLPIYKQAGASWYEPITVEYEPITVAPSKITWSISGYGVATVKEGVITPLREGTFTLTARTYNGLSASVTITLYDATKASSIQFTPPAQWSILDANYNTNILDLSLPQYTKALSTDGNGNELETNISWTMTGGNATLATLDSKTGRLTPLKKGTITVRATDQHSGKYAQATITLVDSTEPTSIYFEEGTAVSKRLSPNGQGGYNTEQLTIKFVPSTHADHLKDQLTWTSGSPAIATIDKDTGVITPLRIGSTRITATLPGTNRTAQCTITFTDPTIADGTFSLSRLDGVRFQLYNSDGTKASINLKDYLVALNGDGTEATTDLRWTVTPTTVAKMVGTKQPNVIEFVRDGIVTVNVTDARSRKTATATVYIYDDTMPKDIGITSDEIHVVNGQNVVYLTRNGNVFNPVQLKWTIDAVAQDEDPNTTITWGVSPSIVTFPGNSNKTEVHAKSGTFNITPRQTGTITITATTANGMKDTLTLVLTDGASITSITPTPGTHAIDYATVDRSATFDLLSADYIQVATANGAAHNRSDLVISLSGGNGWYSGIRDGVLSLNRTDTNAMKTGTNATLTVTVTSRTNNQIKASYTIAFGNTSTFSIEGGPNLGTWSELDANGNFMPMTIRLSAGNTLAINPSNVKWSPTDSISKAEVAADGKSVVVYPSRPGTVTITLSSATGGYSAACTVTFADSSRVTALKLNDINAAKTIDMSETTTVDMNAFVVPTPSNAYSNPLNTKTWSVIQGTDVLAFADASSGIMSVLGVGTARVVCKDVRSGLSAEITIHVVDGDMITSIEAADGTRTWDRSGMTSGQGLTLPIDALRDNYFTIAPSGYNAGHLYYIINDAASRKFVSNIDTNGRLQGLSIQFKDDAGLGEGTVNVKIVDGLSGKSAIKAIQLIDNAQPASVEIVGMPTQLSVNEVLSLEAKSIPRTGVSGDLEVNANYEWTVAENGSVASVRQLGKNDWILVPNKEGRVKLTVVETNSGVKTTMSSWLYIYSEDTLTAKTAYNGREYGNNASLTVATGTGDGKLTSIDLSAVLTSANGYAIDAKDFNLTWTSGNKQVLRVGNVNDATGSATLNIVGVGNAKITVTTGKVTTSILVSIIQ